MKRVDIINTIGKEFLDSNIENDEFSYKKGLESIGKNYLDYINPNAKRKYKDLDIRFVKDNVSVLVETKQTLSRSSMEADIQQLQHYINYEKELTNNKIIAILAATNNDKLYVWNNVIEDISLDNYNVEETTIKPMQEYLDQFFGTKNNKIKVIQSTYELNELLHNYGIKEEIRSQFVGSCLLALKNNVSFKNLSNKQIRAGIEETLTHLLNDDINKAVKLVILKEKVIDSQYVKKLTQEQFCEILEFIKNNILPFINDKNLAGQDLLNLFFTTFNKYVGKADKNQAFTPDHIAHFMSKVVEVNRKSVILDPCCGSGAFLVRAMTEALNDCTTEKERDNIKSNQIYGIEDEEKAFGLSTTNMLIHGDGNSNVIKGSCFEKLDDLTDKGINVVLMNPPYNATRNHCNPEYVKTWTKQTKQDPSKGFHFVYEVAHKIGTGKLAVLLPMACAIGSNKDIIYYKEKMLEENTLEAVFSLPSDMFHPGSSVCACCMVFKLGYRHKNDNSEGTFFGYYKDDGYVKKKNLGRVERDEGVWKQIEAKWLNLFLNKKTVSGLSAVKKVSADDEWLAEAYMETDYSTLNTLDFEDTVRSYYSYVIKNIKSDE